MIVAAPERRPDPAEDTKRAPVHAYLRQRRTYQRADEHQVAAILGAKKLYRPADLTNRTPVMAKALDRHRIAGAFQREQDRTDAARDQAVGDRERHDASGRDQPDRR